jgi:hypothetical protein
MDDQTGYAVGLNIFKTTNGGFSWENQGSITAKCLYCVIFPEDDKTGYAGGLTGTILKTTDGGASFVEQATEVRGQRLEVRIKATPNPFTSYATIPGHEGEHFALYDITGRRVGTYRGDRVGGDIGPGVYFLRRLDGGTPPVRIVKVR